MDILTELGRKANEGREVKGLSTEPFAIMAKITEEVGEIARALVGVFEDRPGRGSVVQEAAQTVAVIASLVQRMYPDEELWTQVQLEQARFLS